MPITYGQLTENGNTGKRMSYNEYEKQVADKLKQYCLIKPTLKSVKLCRKLYHKGYTISDTVSFIILNL